VGALVVPFLVVSMTAAPGIGAQTQDPTGSTTEVPTTTVADPTSTTTTAAPPAGTDPAPPPPDPAPTTPSAPPVEQEAEYRPDEELATARLLVQQQMSQMGDTQQVIESMRVKIEQELAVLDAQMSEAEAVAGRARQAAFDAEEALAVAEEAARTTQDAAVSSRGVARDSVVDAFMSPMSMPVRALDDQNEATFARGLIESRADHRVELAKAAADAEDSARRARDTAIAANEESKRAAADAADASRRMSEARTARVWELEDLATYMVALAEQTAVLGQFDTVLQQQEMVRVIEGRIAASQPVDKAATVRIPGTTIDAHHMIADQVAALIEAARVDGIALDGWGWRSHQRQIELRISHCGPDPYSIYEAPASSCSPPTARPGSSMHERGVAVDFKDCDERSTPCYRWLAEHAYQYGLYNLPSEPWHWSTNGR
jgi:hypothetical protein